MCRGPWTTQFVLPLALAALAGAPVTTFSQTPAYFWGESYGHFSGIERLYDVATDSHGNVIVIGYFNYQIDFGGGPLPWSGGQDTFLAKLSPSGNHLWSKSFGISGLTHGRSIAIDGDDNIIITGRFSGSADFQGGGIYTTLTSAGDYDIFVAKFDPLGLPLWSDSFGDSSYQAPHDIAVGPDGGIVIPGVFAGSVDFGDGVLTSAGGNDGFVAKFDAGGTLEWSRGFGGTGSDQANGVAIDAGGNIALIGDFENAVDFGGGALTSAGSRDVFAAVYDAAGSHVRSQRFGDTTIQYGARCSFDSTDDLLLTGYFYGSMDFGGGPIFSSGARDIFLAKLDTTGAHQWSRKFGDNHSQYVSDIDVDGNDRVVIAGDFYGSVDFGGGPLTSVDLGDVYVATFDAAGTHVSSRSFGGEDDQNLWGVDADGYDNITFAGDFSGSIDLGNGPLTSGALDTYIARYFHTGPPVIRAVRDVPGDQGGRINLSWDASGADIDMDIVEAVDHYSIWRAISPEAAASLKAGMSAASGSGNASAVISPLPRAREQVLGASTYNWQLVDSIGASFLAGYSAPVATLLDSTAAGTPLHIFQVIAHTGDPGAYYVSAPDSGYSVDNLAPVAPRGLFAIQLDSAALELVWRRNSTADLDHYAVYRGADASFVPAPGNLIASTADTSSVDTGWRSSAGDYYKVSAVDVHGNESDFALLQPDNITRIHDTPARTFLARNTPNPFNPTTRIAFSLDAPQVVTLEIYDARGARVRTLASGEHEAARRYEISWDGRDDRGRPAASGVYFFRLSGEHVLLTRKAVLLK
jgi:hypothetical protein